MFDNKPTAAQIRAMRGDAARVRAQRMETHAAQLAEAFRDDDTEHAAQPVEAVA